MKKALFLLTLLLGFSIQVQAAELYEIQWNSLLQKNVKFTSKKQTEGTFVDYEGIKNSQSFTSLIRNIAQFDTQNLKTENAKKAFWINVYNIAVVKLVIENYPTASIHTPNDDILWKRPVIFVNNKIMTLQDIEFGKLSEFDDFRIIFCLANATFSGPDLLETSYSEEQIENQLNAQFKRFITNDSKGIELHKGTSEAKLSPLLKHLEDTEVGLIGTLQPFFKEDLKTYRIRYMNYNWSLNSK